MELNQSSKALRQKRSRLLKEFPPIESILRGSLIERYKRCGRKKCKCAQGPGHGPKYYLSVSRSGTTPRMDYVPLAYHEQVVGWLNNYRQVRDILEQISEINRELLRRRERL